MTVATTNNNIDQSSDAGFRVWIQEIITALFTSIGVTQTGDTGQINTSTVTRPVVINTAAGYVIGRFNDSLQSTSPIFFKLEFGVGSVQPTQCNAWISVGTGSNGSGTLTGTVSTRFSICGGINPGVTPIYNSRYCYTATMGFLGFTFKINSIGSNGNLMTLLLGRTCDDTGTPTANAYMVIATNSTTSQAVNAGNAQCYSFVSSSFATLASTSLFAALAFSLISVSSVAVNGKVTPFPCFSRDQGLGVFPQIAVTDQGVFLHQTLNIAMSGTTKHLMLVCGFPWGVTGFGGSSGGFLLMIYE